MRKQITAGLLILALSASLVPNVDTKAASLQICKKKVTLCKGTSCTLKIKGLKNKKAVTWKSSNKKIATVNKKGVVCAKKKGTVTITAKTKKQKLICKVTVTGKKSVIIKLPAATDAPSVTQGPPAATEPAFTPALPAVRTPAPSQAPTVTVVPIQSQTPVVTLAPVQSQTPAVTKAPVQSQAPASTKAPSFTLPPFLNWFPSVTWNPAATKSPDATLTPSATRMPAATQSPTTTKAPGSSSFSSVTEADAYQILNSLRSTYPEGMPLTNSYYYYSPCFGNGYGCYGFAAKLSDTVFGTGTSCSTHTSFDNIKVGDNIRIGNSHSVIVLTKNGDSITVVEGNYNSSVHWDRTITKASLAKDGFKVTTRY